MCIRSKCELIIGLLILLLNYLVWQYSKISITVLAIILIIHSFACKSCNCDCSCEMEEKPSKKARKR
jgi:hypothetical protein